MKNWILRSVLLILSLASGRNLSAHLKVEGQIRNHSGAPLEGANVFIRGFPVLSITDASGHFQLSVDADSGILDIRHYAYESISLKIKSAEKPVMKLDFTLKEVQFQIAAIEVKSRSLNLISKLDLQSRPLNNAQEMLRLVPGLFIAQHSGGGKAEQIFLRGFDVDHGTDFSISVDGMPVNMPSHAHGQGYSDLHFLIPETVASLEVYKGPHSARFGDFATAGACRFNTMDNPEKSMLKLESGQFNTQRITSIIKLLQKRKLFERAQENLYVAGEYKFSDSYFQQDQNFIRFNLLGKYSAVFRNTYRFSLSASKFFSSWNAAGLIPEREVERGVLSEFGSIDPSEGGKTSRTNINALLTRKLNDGAMKSQVYYSRYDFNLYSNFTYFLVDSVNGDQISQTDGRNLFGLSQVLEKSYTFGGFRIFSESGAGLRYDNSDLHLARTSQRKYLSSITNGKLNQLNYWLYSSHKTSLGNKLNLEFAGRLDAYSFSFREPQNSATARPVNKLRFSPKFNLSYLLNRFSELSFKSAMGFHSNDARVVVSDPNANTLPRAFGNEIGTLLKLTRNSLIEIAFWSLDLESELVYVGDEGIVEASGRSRRIGVDFSIRQDIGKFLRFDLDVNSNKARFRDNPEGEQRIPLAPWLTSSAGILYKAKGFNAGLRYRYIAERPASEDNSIKAEAYFICDASLSYSFKKIEFGLNAENLFNQSWKEAQFASISKLQNEEAEVTDLHFTAGSPRFVKLIGTYRF